MTDQDDDSIPTIGDHRGVPLHDFQDEPRLAVVRADIDAAMTIGDPVALVRFMEDRSRAPEARRFAEMKIRALFERTADRREVRPLVDLAYVGALGAGLDSRKWRNPWCYGSLFDARCDPPPPKRPRVLSDDVSAGRVAP